eukprot:6240677-Pyramimonas_sp.AAC.1
MPSHTGGGALDVASGHAERRWRSSVEGGALAPTSVRTRRRGRSPRFASRTASAGAFPGRLR